jgi:hypothetical protein
MDMSPAFHIAVNCVRSNALADLTPMNDTSELWSLPWHALQRSLAQTRCDQMPAEASFRKSLAHARRKPVEADHRRARVRRFDGDAIPPR